MFCAEMEKPVCRSFKPKSEKNIDCENSLEIKNEKNVFNLEGKYKTWKGTSDYFFKNSQPESCFMN